MSIVGISLVRDEDLFVEQSLRNVVDFCDTLLLVDHLSKDGTGAILDRFAAEHPEKAHVHRIRHPPESHDLIKHYAGEDVWIFAVDGDELYDPARLLEFRKRLLAGELADAWIVRGNTLHCDELAADRSSASGWISPPAPSVTKLYNFKLIEAWDGPCAERLHGANGLRFRPGTEAPKYGMQHDHTWEGSPFRCLHMCFVRRSTLQRAARPRPRPNITDLNAPRRFPVRVWHRTRAAAGVPRRSDWKANYRQGERITVSAVEFFD